ncbi:MAG TPA: helix-turn-helix transcriptional regulator [Candidatus Coprocola pullicola]|nr:helix-turn-helix transcriptional regulator [Candidatus Coprocola pullicola]
MLGKRLSELRKNASMTQKELAAKLNLTAYSISAYENNHNEPPDSVKILIAKTFNVSIDYLLGLTNNQNPYEPNRRCFYLPPSFPTSKEQDLKDYIEFLIFQSKKTQHKS